MIGSGFVKVGSSISPQVGCRHIGHVLGPNAALLNWSRSAFWW